jgi:hypothetical protein
VSNGSNERKKPPRDRGDVSLEEAAKLLGVTPEWVRAELVRELTAGDELAANIRVPRTLVARLGRDRRA